MVFYTRFNRIYLVNKCLQMFLCVFLYDEITYVPWGRLRVFENDLEIISIIDLHSTLIIVLMYLQNILYGVDTSKRC